MEALVAALLELDHGHLGYDLGPLELNPRVQTGEKSTRVPDIFFTGTHLGINYDSSMHLDDRDRLVDDKRRTRELLSAGVSVLPMTSEDLSEKGGFDRLARQVMNFLEASEGRGVSRQRAFMARKRVQKERQELIWSLMPGDRGARISRVAAGGGGAAAEIVEVERRHRERRSPMNSAREQSPASPTGAMWGLKGAGPCKCTLRGEKCLRAARPTRPTPYCSH